MIAVVSLAKDGRIAGLEGVPRHDARIGRLQEDVRELRSRDSQAGDRDARLGLLKAT